MFDRTNKGSGHIYSHSIPSIECKIETEILCKNEAEGLARHVTFHLKEHENEALFFLKVQIYSLKGLSHKNVQN
jgi:hypothetical protein